MGLLYQLNACAAAMPAHKILMHVNNAFIHVCAGPFVCKGFQLMDKVFGPQLTLAAACKKTAMGQMTMFPIYTVAFNMYTGVLEGRSVPQAVEKTRQNFLPTFVAGSVFWPVANMFNFAAIAPRHRVLYVGVVGVTWNAFLSWQNNLQSGVQQTGAEGWFEQSSPAMHDTKASG